MQDHDKTKPPAIPQRVHDWYNSHYSNTTYRTFRAALTESVCYGQLSTAQSNDDFIDTTMNLLIDASFERSGAGLYRGAEDRLLMQIEALDSRVIHLARAHLMNFGGSPHEETAQAIMQARLFAETAASAASDLHSWRGRVAFAWANAATHLLHAAFIVLTETTTDPYALEKLDRALGHLQNGVIEARNNGFAPSDGFIAWMQNLVKSRR